MRAIKKTTFVIASLAVLVSGGLSISGNREGNGGDHVRSTFIKMGKAVVQYLRTADAGVALVSKFSLNVDQLDAGLDIERISVVEEALIDNGGSDVDAIGVPGKITLRKDRWYSHFENDRDVYYLVFHELLRSAGVNDDNYVISAAVRPFPAADRVVTRIANFLPLIAMDNVASFLPGDAKAIAVAGKGCATDNFFMDLDAEHGVLNLAFEAYRALGTTDRSACDLRIPVTMNPNRRLVVSQVDLSGRVKLPAGAMLAAALRPNLGTMVGATVKKVVSGAELGRFAIRTNPAFSTTCESGSSLLGLNTNVVLQSPSDEAVVDVDRLSVYFRVEACR